MTNRTIVGIKRTIVGILRPVIGEAALTRLSITWRRAVSGPRPLPVPIEEPSAGTAVAAAVTAKPAKPGKKSLNAAFGLARTMPGFLTPDDLESLYDLGRGGGTVCWIGNSDEDSQAAAMLYAGGADLVVSGPPDSNTGDFNAGGAAPGLVVVQKDAVVPDPLQAAVRASGTRLVRLDGFSARGAKMAHLHSRLADRERLRIVIVNDVCFQYGAGTATRRQAQSFMQAGWDVAVVCWSPGADIACPAISQTTPGGRWLGVRALHDVHASMGHSAAGLTARVVAEVRALNPDFVLVGNLHGAGWPIDILPGLRDDGFPVAAYMHDLHWVTGRCAYTGTCKAFIDGCHAGCPTADQYPPLPPAGIAAAWRRRAEVFTGPSAVPLIANSDWTGTVTRSRFGDAARVETVYLGLDHKLFAPMDKAMARRLLGLPQDKPLILLGSVNVAEERKGGPVLAQLLGALDRRDDVEVLVFGHGSERLKNGRALGFISDEHQMALVYNAADIFIGSAREEAFGQTLLEASACGLPVVAFRVGGVVEVAVDGVTGLLPQDLTARAVLDAVDGLLADPARSRRMGAAGRARVVEKFSLPVQAGAWRNALLNLSRPQPNSLRSST
jgi:glycosyltransferase involved in cell wall biosynthesis